MVKEPWGKSQRELRLPFTLRRNHSPGPHPQSRRFHTCMSLSVVPSPRRLTLVGFSEADVSKPERSHFLPEKTAAVKWTEGHVYRCHKMTSEISLNYATLKLCTHLGDRWSSFVGKCSGFCWGVCFWDPPVALSPSVEVSSHTGTVQLNRPQASKSQLFWSCPISCPTTVIGL